MAATTLMASLAELEGNLAFQTIVAEMERGVEMATAQLISGKHDDDINRGIIHAANNFLRLPAQLRREAGEIINNDRGDT